VFIVLLFLNLSAYSILAFQQIAIFKEWMFLFMENLGFVPIFILYWIRQSES